MCNSRHKVHCTYSASQIKRTVITIQNHYTTLHYTTLHCTTLHYTTLHYTMVTVTDLQCTLATNEGYNSHYRPWEASVVART